jgi:hypothetical protein
MDKTKTDSAALARNLIEQHVHRIVTHVIACVPRRPDPPTGAKRQGRRQPQGAIGDYRPGLIELTLAPSVERRFFHFNPLA